MIRDDSVHVSWSTRYCLSMVAKAMEDVDVANADALAERILQAWLEANHPELLRHLQERNDDEKSVQQALKFKIKSEAQ